MNTPEQSPLGKTSAWPERIDAALLFPIPRSQARSLMGIGAELPFTGFDLWTAYELSWLDRRGKPRVGIAEFQVGADSPNLIESKSLKLYLNGFAQVRMDSDQTLCATIAADLAQACGAEVVVHVAPVTGAMALCDLDGECIDAQDLDIDVYGPPDPGHLSASSDQVDEALVSHLFRSNCPVTGQPDWASLQIRYRGPRVDRAGLLRYIVSFRTHQGFHEQCVERIFVDLCARCEPESLSVLARFTRRGGIDINPWRATPGLPPPAPVRCARQ